MERRWLNVRKFLLRRTLPVLRMLPLPLASRMIASIGRTEYRLYPRLQQGYQAAVTRAREILGCAWDVPTVSLDLAGNQIWWRTRDLLLDNVPDHRVEPMFIISGREILDTALARGKGVILLTSHFGATCCRRTGWPGTVIPSASTWSAPARIAIPGAAVPYGRPDPPGPAVHLA